MVAIGAVLVATDRSASPAELGEACEERGLESLFFAEHTHIPVSRATPFPLAAELPDEYHRTVDPYVACAVAAAVTENLRVGPCISLVAQHDPILLAKTIATIDLTSGGRFELGVGHGWNVEEAADHGVDWATRRQRVRETVEAMKVLWTEEQAAYSGDIIRFDPCWQWPKPVQRPHPPVLLGAGPGPKNFAAIIGWADGWMPVPFFGHTPDHVVALRRAAEDAGRDPATIGITVDGVYPTPELVEPWLAIDVDRILVPLPPEPLSAAEALLDGAASLQAACV